MLSGILVSSKENSTAVKSPNLMPNMLRKKNQEQQCLKSLYLAERLQAHTHTRKYIASFDEEFQKKKIYSILIGLIDKSARRG